MVVMVVMAIMAVMAGTAVMAGMAVMGGMAVMVGADGGGAQASASTSPRVIGITATDTIPTGIPATDTIPTDTTGIGTIVIIGITGGTTVMGTTVMAMGDIINERVTTGGGRSCIAARAA